MTNRDAIEFAQYVLDKYGLTGKLEADVLEKALREYQEQKRRASQSDLWPEQAP